MKKIREQVNWGNNNVLLEIIEKYKKLISDKINYICIYESERKPKLNVPNY